MAPQKLPIALLIKLALAGLALGAAAVLLLRGVDLRALLHEGVERVRAAGPVVFFGALSVLPAFGFPVSPFYISAGPTFGPAVAIPATLAAMTVNVSLSYFLARYAFRPFLEKLVQRFGYQMPEVKERNAMRLIFVVRIAPGLPLSIQSYMLGLARVPFFLYVLISMLVQGIIATCVILFGKALFTGQTGLILAAFALVAVAFIVLQWLRKHYGSRNAKTA